MQGGEQREIIAVLSLLPTLCSAGAAHPSPSSLCAQQSHQTPARATAQTRTGTAEKTGGISGAGRPGALPQAAPKARGPAQEHPQHPKGSSWELPAPPGKAKSISNLMQVFQEQSVLSAPIPRPPPLLFFSAGVSHPSIPFGILASLGDHQASPVASSWLRAPLMSLIQLQPQHPESLEPTPRSRTRNSKRINIPQPLPGG